MSIWGAVGAGVGLVAGGAIAFFTAGAGTPLISTTVGMGASFGMSLGTAVGGIADSNIQKNEIEATAKEVDAEQTKLKNQGAIREAAQMVEAAGRNPTNTSATMFRKAELERSANTQHAAAIGDKANPFHATEDKAGKAAQNYGRPVANRAA